MEERASKSYKSFIDSFLLYQALFEGSGDLRALLQLPYPLYSDVILRQIEEKRKEKKRLDEKQRTVKLKTRSANKR